MPIKLGKKAPRLDGRTIKFAAILRKEKLPAVPDTYDIDQVLGVVDKNTFNNLTYGDCVIAGRAHQTLRFEKFEQGQLIAITDQDVTQEYFKETGGADNGLVMLDSLNEWRQQGWQAAGKTYTIYAFASTDWKNHDEIKQCIYLLNGVYFGMLVPQYALDDFEAGKRLWDISPTGDQNIVGGHAVYTPAYLNIVGYNEVGPVCVTWGDRVQMTWAFWDKYVDEAYAVIDSKDSWVDPASDPLDMALLAQYLQDITGQAPQPPVEPTPPPTPTPPAPTVTTESLPDGVVGQAYSATLEATGGTPPYLWSMFGSSLPTGLTLSVSGVIFGVPVAAGKAFIAFLVKDGVGSQAGAEFYLTVKKSSPCKWGNGVVAVLNIWPRAFRRKGRFQYLNPPGQ